MKAEFEDAVDDPVQTRYHLGRQASVIKYANELGAELVINTRKQDFVERTMEWTDGRGVDVVIDSLGGHVLAKNINVARYC